MHRFRHGLPRKPGPLKKRVRDTVYAGYRRQKPFKGGRIPVGARFEPNIEKALQWVCQTHKVRRQVVITIALADFLHIDQDEKL